MQYLIREDITPYLCLSITYTISFRFVSLLLRNLPTHARSLYFSLSSLLFFFLSLLLALYLYFSQPSLSLFLSLVLSQFLILCLFLSFFPLVLLSLFFSPFSSLLFIHLCLFFSLSQISVTSLHHITLHFWT